MWYPPISPIILALLSLISGLDLPTLSSRIIPFFEAFTPLPIFFLARYIYCETAGYVSTLSLALTPTFVFWTGISDPQSFTLFFIPLYILLWLKHAAKPDNNNIYILGILLALNFLVHLSFFLVLLVLISISVGLVILKSAGKWILSDLLKVIVISQLITIPWWLPKNLYWWWIQALVTSSGMYSAKWQVGDYGVVAFVLGIVSFSYIIFTLAHDISLHGKTVIERRSAIKGHLLLLLWAVPLFLESQNEAILFAMNRVDLTWTTLAKPLEGFRFFPFLAQPVAIAIGALSSELLQSKPLKKVDWKKTQSILLILIGGSLLWGIIGHYQIETKFQTSGLLEEEYIAAEWFRENSTEDSRIIADYYRAQMFSGVTGGKSLDGGMFPLRNVDLPYISVPAIVQDDIYLIYNTSDPFIANSLAKKYGVTHIFYSKNMENYGNLLSNYQPSSQFGVSINLTKFNDQDLFKLIYDQNGVISIYEVL